MATIHRSTRCLGIAIGTLLAITSPASAVTILVNGDTPAVYYQRVADTIDRHGIRTPTDPVTLRLSSLGINLQPEVDPHQLTTLPDGVTAVTVSGVWAGYTDGDGAEVWVNDRMRRFFEPRWAFRHELGHAFRRRHVSDEQLTSLAAIVSIDDPDQLEEVFADAYMGCGYSRDPRRARIVVARHGTDGTAILTKRAVMWRVCDWLRTL